MMYEVCVAASFEAAHRLVGDFGPAARLHGHTYRVEAIVRGASLKADDTLFDIGELKGGLDSLAADLHYRNLDEVDGLSERNTTAETVANYFWERISPKLAGHDLETLTVRVWENADVYAAREDAV